MTPPVDPEKEWERVHKGLHRECLFHRTCSGSCSLVDRGLGWTQPLPEFMCRTCLNHGGPLDPHSHPVRLAIKGVVVGGVGRNLARQRPDVVTFMLAWHLTNEEYLRWEPVFKGHYGPEFFARVRLSRGLPTTKDGTG